MEKIKVFYTEEGYLCNRYPTYAPITDKTQYIEVDENTYGKLGVYPIYHVWKVVNGELVITHYDDMSEEMKLEEQKFLSKREIYEKKEYLSQTDYVITKINEAQAYGDEVEVADLKAQYAETLENRKVYRARINELEEQLKELEV